MPMHRSFNHAEAYERALAGESTGQIGEDLGVSKNAVGAAILREHVARTGSKTCVGCGAPVSISIRCRRCAELRAASQRRGLPDMACSKCGEIKQADAFRVSRSGRRHSHCNVCAARARHEYRRTKELDNRTLAEIKEILLDVQGLVLQLADTTPGFRLPLTEQDCDDIMGDVEEFLNSKEEAQYLDRTQAAGAMGMPEKLFNRHVGSGVTAFLMPGRLPQEVAGHE